MQPLSNASGLIYDPFVNEYLLHFRDNRTAFHPESWALFGGSCEGTETPREGLLRELQEELCLRVHPKTALARGRREKPGKQYSYYFLVLINRDRHDLILQEGAGMAWFQPEDLVDLTKRTRVTPALIYLRDKGLIYVSEEKRNTYKALISKYA
jgi:ADP-ribose pyrophosphatase YjhB (NUDIX family)